MATYNRAHFIVETLKSIQNQNFLDWECIIVDDGGADDTAEIIVPILEKDSRFLFFNRPEKYKKGLPGCRNFGLDIAKGDCIVFFDDDDIVHPDILKISLEVLEVSNTDFCHYQKQSFEDEKPTFEIRSVSIFKLLDIVDIEKVVTQEIGLASCTVLWKKKCFDSIRFNESLLYAEEWDCYTRIITENSKGIIINNTLYYNRKHPESNTGEFFRNDSLRRASNKEAILQVVKNLKEKKLISNSLLRHFIQISLGYKEYKLFQKILETGKLTKLKKLKWQLFYITLPIRLFFYGNWKKIKNRFNK